MRGQRVWTAAALVATVAGGLIAPVPASATAPGSVVINEIHYHPPVDGQEFVELFNPGDEAFDLSGACFTVGIGGCFDPGAAIAPGGFVLVAEQPAVLAAAFPTAPTPLLASTGSLSNGGERVTLSAGSTVLDSVAYDDEAPWPFAPDGSGPSLELVDPGADNDTAAAWGSADPAPTPGAVNTRYGQGDPPTLGGLELGAVAADQPVALAVDVGGASSVVVEVTVGFDAPTTVALVDDGAHGDGAAGDGRYGGSIPGRPAGTLVRYRVVAGSASGSATVPASGDPRRLLGYVVAPPPVASALPVIDWRIAPADYQHLLDNAQTNDYVPAVVVVDGEVWDGASVRVHGNSRVAPKYAFKFKMPAGSPLDAAFLDGPVDEFVLDEDRRDPTGIVAPLAMSVYADGNDLAPQVAKVRVQRDGQFYGLYTFVEEFDRSWRERTGLDGPGDEQYDPEGAVATLQDDGSAAALEARFEKVAPGGGYESLYELVRVVDSAPTPERAARLRDLFDVPALIEFLAVGALITHWDTTVHNFELVRDGSTGRWRFAPADMDFTLGMPVSGGSNPTWLRVPGVFPFGPDNLVSALRSDPELGDLYLRRLRTLADRYLAGGELRARADQLAPAVAAEHELDRAAWGLDQAQSLGLAKLQEYLAARTDDLLVTHRVAGEVPAAPTPGATVAIRGAVFAAPGGPDHDAVELGGPVGEAVDVSGWRLEGAGTATLPPGSVVPAGGTLVVPGDPLAGAADRLPGTLVAGRLAAGLDDAGGILRLVDQAGATRAEVVLADLAPPSPASPPLVLEASADQVEQAPGDGSGVRFTVAVANHGSSPLASVVLVGGGTTCGRSLGTLPPGGVVTVRCSSIATDGPDRTYRFTASSGSVSAAAPVVRVRTLGPRTNVWWQRLPAAPGAPSVTLGPDGTLRAEVQLPVVAETAPLRWLVASGTEPGRGVPTAGQVVAPSEALALDALALDRPVRVAVAARNAAGTGPRTPPTPFLTPRSSSTWPFDDAADLVEHVFADLQGRPPTAAEAASWTSTLQGGASPATLIEDRLAQPRWAATVMPLVRLYAAYFQRPPDPSGLAYWRGRRERGVGLDAISASFAATREFRRTYGVLGDRAFVTLVYRNVLGRSPDASGLAYWTRQLGAGRSRGRVMTAFSESSEGARSLMPIAGPCLVQVALTGAPPSTTALEPAREWVAGGGSMRTVIDAVRSSDEYREAVTVGVTNDQRFGNPASPARPRRR